MLVIKQPDYPPPNGDPAYRELGVITDEQVHHSAGSPSQSPLDIDAEHRARDMVMIAYNFLIGPEGTIYQGRPLNMVPAATQGFNTIGVPICLLGNFQSDDAGYSGPPTDLQVQALKELSVYVHQKVPNIMNTKGHRDYMSDACPGDKLYELLPEIRAYVHAHLGA